MKTREQKIDEVISLFDKHVRGAGDAPGVEARVKDYMREFIDPIRNANWDVLDAGAGDAYTADYLLGKINSWVGINKGIDLINTQSKYNILEMDFHDLQFEDNSFDLVLAVNTLEHSYFPALYISELRRVSKEYVFIDLPLAMCDGGNHCHEENPDHHYLMSQFMWEKMFNIIGLSIVKKGIYGAEVQYLLKKSNPAIAA